MDESLIRDKAKVTAICLNEKCINFDKIHEIENNGEFINKPTPQCAYCMRVMDYSAITQEARHQ